MGSDQISGPSQPSWTGMAGRSVDSGREGSKRESREPSLEARVAVARKWSDGSLD